MFLRVAVSCESGVLLIGDSHSLLSGAHLSFGTYDIHSQLGRGSGEGLQILDERLRPRHRVVVFDLSTNDIGDPDAFAVNLETLHERTGTRGLLLVNCWRGDGGNTHAEVNRVQAEFVARHPQRSALVDWATYIDGHPEALTSNPDFVHFTADAYRRRTEMIIAGVERVSALSL